MQLNIDLNEFVEAAMRNGESHIRIRVYATRTPETHYYLGIDVLRGSKLDWVECCVEIQAGDNHAQMLQPLVEAVNERIRKKTTSADREAESPAGG